MHKRRLLVFREPEVNTILQRTLASRGFQVFPKVRLADAIQKDASEYLGNREFGYLTRAHFDFLVTKDFVPQFAVEFDGLTHAEPDAVERDVLKNRLCKSAGLPLLRITSAELTARDKLTALDYMMGRFVAWRDELPDIQRELQAQAAGLPADADPHDYIDYFDPSIHFDLQHPFPATAAVRDRLWLRYGIAPTVGGRGYEAEHPSSRHARLLCDVGSSMTQGPLLREAFTTCRLKVLVWEPSRPAEPLLEREVEASIRSWLPLKVTPPAPLSLDAFLSLAGTSIKQMTDRFDYMWFADLPGVSPWDIAENLAEYLGFRAVEDWAKSQIRH